MNSVMDSHYLKAAVLAYFRFNKSFEYSTCEVGAFNADVLCSNGQDLVECEVKISRSDFLAEAKKPKHGPYQDPSKRFYSNGYNSKNWIPNRFYIVVPEEMESYCLERMGKFHKSYGLMICKDLRSIRNNSVKVVKRAKRLHEGQVKPVVLKKMLLRMSSDLANIYIHKALSKETMSVINEISERNTNIEMMTKD